MVKIAPSNDAATKTVQNLREIQEERYLKKILRKSYNKVYKKCSSKLVFHPESIFRMGWDIMLLVTILYQAITIPYFLCFNYSYDINIESVELFINLVFFIDILFSFNTGFYVKGSLVVKRIEIAKQYVKLWFWVDLVASFPYTWTIEGIFPRSETSTNAKGVYNAPKILRIIRIIRYLRILRLLRLAKLKKILMEIEDYIASNALSNLFMVFRFLCMSFLGAHWIACLWYFVGTQDQETHPVTWIVYANIQDCSNYEQYITSLYWVFTTVSTVGYGDITPITVQEKVFTTLVVVISSGLFAYIVGTLGSLISKENELNNTYREMVVSVNSYMKTKNLPKELQYRVRRYLDYLWEKKKKNKIDEKELLSLLSEPLRDEFYLYINANIIKHCKVFDHFNKAFISQLTRSLESETFALGDRVFDQGETSHKIYYIITGRVDIYHSSTQSSLAKLSSKQYFGEISFFLNTTRCASATCAEFSDLLSLSRTDFDFFLEKFPDAVKYTKELCLKCKEGDYSSLLVNCYICEELGHVATQCKYILLNYDRDQSKQNWLQSKLVEAHIEDNDSKYLCTETKKPVKTASVYVNRKYSVPNFFRFDKKVKKIRYGLINTEHNRPSSFNAISDDEKAMKSDSVNSEIKKNLTENSTGLSDKYSPQVTVRPKVSIPFKYSEEDDSSASQDTLKKNQDDVIAHFFNSNLEEEKKIA